LLSSACGTRLEGDELASARAGGTDRSGVAGGTSSTGQSNGSQATGDAAGTFTDSAGTTAAAPGAVDTGADATGGTESAGGAGTGGDSAATGATSGGAASATGAGSTILLGTVGTFSGPSGSAWKPGVDGVQIWAKDVNRRGGLDGHPVKVLVADDGGDPARHLSLVKEFVENRKVFAFVYTVVSTSYSKAVEDYLIKKGIVVVGGDASAKLWETSKPYFPMGTTQSGALFSHMKAAKQLHPEMKKIAVLTCREAQGCTEAATGWPEAGKKVGFETVYRAEVSIAQPDFTAECLGARNAGAELMFVAVDPNSVRRLGSSCGRQTYKPVYVLPSGVISSGQARDENLEGALGVNLVMPWMSSATPGQKEWQAAVKRFNPSLQLNITTPFGWVSGKMLEKAGTGRIGANPSRAGLLAGLLTFKGETLGGIAPPLTFTASRKNSECWFTVNFKGGSWKEGEGGLAGCP
jgi:branched-chain amino acid transport system substrate-binding protein